MGQNIILSIITPVFSVTWSFRNHSNMLICCSNCFFYCYQCLKHLKLTVCVETVITFSTITKKTVHKIWPYNIFLYTLSLSCVWFISAAQINFLFHCMSHCRSEFRVDLNSSRLKSWLTDSVYVSVCSVKDVSNKEVLGVLVSYRVKVKLVVSRGGWVTCFLSTVSHTLGSSFDWSVTVHKY